MPVGRDQHKEGRELTHAVAPFRAELVITKAHPELEKRFTFDRTKAKQLLTDAGYPGGFEVTLSRSSRRALVGVPLCW